MMQLLLIFVALIGGYLCKNIRINNNILNKFLSTSVLLILVVMGYEFGSSSSDMFIELKLLSKIILVSVVTLFLLNYISVYLYARFTRVKDATSSSSTKSSGLYTTISSLYKYFMESGKYILCVFLGTCAGYFLKSPLTHLSLIINLILLVILFIIGYQLKQQNISLRSILTNKTGITIAGLIILSSIVAGIISAKILGIDIRTGVVLSSGYGWYTLSGILIGQLAPHGFGTAAFFIDFIREIIAIILIPAIGKKHPLPLVAYSGATALDFTLPIIKVNLSESMVPVAITSGMILTMLVPVVIPLFWAIL